MEEIHETLAGEGLGEHQMFGTTCPCQPVLIHRWKDSRVVSLIVRHNKRNIALSSDRWF